MNGQYGEFTNSITALEKALVAVRAHWTDDTAQSFDCMNDNIKGCANNIWLVYSDSYNAAEAVRQNYKADAFDDDIARLASLTEQV